MKKIKIIVLLIILSILISSCSGIISVNSLDFPINENMKLESTRENEVDGKTVELSTYSVQNGDINSFLFEYEEILNNKGWETASNLKPRGLTVKKDKNEVTIIIYEKDNTLLVDIIPAPKENN